MKRPRTARRRYRALYEAIETLQPQTILEIGVETGENAEAMIERAGSPRYFGVDIALDPAVERRLAGPKVSLHRGASAEVLPRMRDAWPKMDLIFIDGGHELVDQALDWHNCQPLMHARTVVFIDDYFLTTDRRGCRALIDELLERPDYRVAVHGPADVTERGKVIAMASVRPA